MKKTISLILISLLLILSLTFGGCGKSKDSFDVTSEKLKVVTTIFPYYDFVRSIAGDKAELKLLLSPGNEPHSYDPSPSDIVAVENCDIFIYNGGESDEWVESVLDSIENKNIHILRMMDYVSLIEEEEGEEEHSHEGEEHHKEETEYDEHIWTSLRNSIELVKAVSSQLQNCDETNSSYYEKQTDILINNLKKLDDEFTSVVSNAKRNNIVFGDRFPIIYFVNDYGIDYDCAFPGCSSETEPSISTVKRLIDYTRDESIPVVFYLEFSSGNVARLIAEDSSAKIMRYSSCHNVTKDEFEQGVTYISLMEQNLYAIKEALS